MSCRSRACLLGLFMLALGDPSIAEESSSARSILVNSIGMKLAQLPAGEYEMGSAPNESDARQDEQPRHRVRITRPFWMGIYEVTQAEYRTVVGHNPSFFSRSGAGKHRVTGIDTDRFPVEDVSWYQANEFCQKLSQLPAEEKAGRRYRLPTEAEWEYACRAGTTTAFHTGRSLGGRDANINGNYPAGDAPKGPFLIRTTEVGSFKPNTFGLYDMHGNVWEWCADRYSADYYRRSPTKNPSGPADGNARVIRGGGWRSDARDCRSAFRYTDVPTGRFYVLGFRVVMTVDEPHGAVSAVKPSGAEHEQSPTAAVAQGVDESTKHQHGEDWPRWRGPRGNGTWHGPELPEKWSTDGLKQRWRQPIGGGYGGVSVSANRVFVMDRQNEPQENERVLCFDAASGKPVWSHAYAAPYEIQYGNGPRATPTVHDGRVYTQGAMGHLHCLDATTGQQIWATHLTDGFGGRMPMWGYSASPVVFEDLLIVMPGAEDGASIVALDRKTGKEVWRSLSDEAGYATPFVIEHRDGQQLVCWTPSHVRSLDPRTGKPLWAVEYKVTYGVSIAMPLFAEDIVFVSGYWEGARAIQLGSRPTEAKLLWQENRNLRGLMSQPLYRNGYAYMLDKRHGLTCFELKTGRKLWDDDNRMTPKGRNPQATMVWLNDSDRCLVLNSDGELLQVRLSPEGYGELSRQKIIGPTWAHPAYSGTNVYARNDEELVCVSLVE